MIEETIQDLKDFKETVDGLDKTTKLIPPITKEDVKNLENKLCPRTYISSNDSRLNYTFCKEEDIQVKNNLPEIIGREMFDYGVVIKKGKEETEKDCGTLDTTAPLSYATINNTETGELWYRESMPNLPEDFYGIIARYTWGQPQTKKSIKNEVKKIKKNPKKPIPQGLTVLKGKFSVSFD
tara:strand:- start:6388 stop:6930 length:543 start_codon:yes stop_codon:yes gene_type:complete